MQKVTPPEIELTESSLPSAPGGDTAGRIPAPGKGQHLGVLLMIAAGCSYLYFSIPQANNSEEENLFLNTTPFAADSLLLHQYELYMKDAEAATRLQHGDSSNRDRVDTVTPKN